MLKKPIASIVSAALLVAGPGHMTLTASAQAVSRGAAAGVTVTPSIGAGLNSPIPAAFLPYSPSLLPSALNSPARLAAPSAAVAAPAVVSPALATLLLPAAAKGAALAVIESRDPSVGVSETAAALDGVFENSVRSGAEVLADQTKLAKAIAANQKVVKGSKFITERGLEEYRSYLGRGFFEKLKRLGPRGHWIDVGAGDANAMTDHFRYATGISQWNNDFPFTTLEGLPIPRMTAITIKPSPGVRRRRIAQSGKFRYLAGRPFEDYPAGEPRPADLITDVFGATSYSPRFDAVIEKMARTLRPNGVAYFNVKVAKLIIKDSLGRRIKVEDWLKTIRGIQVVKIRRFYHYIENTQLRIAFRRTSGPIQAPRLKLVKMEDNDGSPAPRRTYLTVSESEAKNGSPRRRS